MHKNVLAVWRRRGCSFSSDIAARSSAHGGAQRNGEMEGEAPVHKSCICSAPHFFGPPRGTSVPALTGTGCPTSADSAAAEDRRVGRSTSTELTGGSVSAGLSTRDARLNHTSSLYDAQIPVVSINKKVDLYPSLSAVCFHNPALTHIRRVHTKYFSHSSS